MISEADFAQHYRNNYRRVLGLCRQLLGRLHPAEDAAQEVFLRAHRSLASYDATRPFEGWILTIASNYCIDVVRRRRKEAQLFGNESDERIAAEADDTDVLGELLAQERAAELKTAIASLPERYRLPLVLAYYRDASYDEVAAALGITRTHAGALICRAKQALRRALNPARDESRESNAESRSLNKETA
jgi:RNA polymerase sigma-70 factor (ECF subfamily)